MLISHGPTWPNHHEKSSKTLFSHGATKPNNHEKSRKTSIPHGWPARFHHEKSRKRVILHGATNQNLHEKSPKKTIPHGSPKPTNPITQQPTPDPLTTNQPTKTHKKRSQAKPSSILILIFNNLSKLHKSVILPILIVDRHIAVLKSLAIYASQLLVFIKLTVS